MQSLMHACIFCTSNPRGQTTFFASYVLASNSLSFGSSFFTIFSNFSNPESVTPFSSFHFRNSVWYPAFYGHLHNSGTTICCDPLTSARTSTSPFQFRSQTLHQQWPDQDRQRAHLAPLHLQLPQLQYHRIQGT